MELQHYIFMPKNDGARKGEGRTKRTDLTHDSIHKMRFEHLVKARDNNTNSHDLFYLKCSTRSVGCVCIYILLSFMFPPGVNCNSQTFTYTQRSEYNITAFVHSESVWKLERRQSGVWNFL